MFMYETWFHISGPCSKWLQKKIGNVSYLCRFPNRGMASNVALHDTWVLVRASFSKLS